MRRVLVVVEGQTERACFQQSDVAGQFVRRGFALNPRVIGKPGHKGGIRSFQAVLPEIVNLLKQERDVRVSTFFDFYALPLTKWPGYPKSAELPPEVAVQLIEAEMSIVLAKEAPDLRPERFVPYIQLFEFEALLFADPAAMAQTFGAPKLEAVFAGIVEECGGCEQINNGSETAPSKRIAKAFPAYKKRSVSAHAPLIMGQMARSNWGRLLCACPRFSAWLDRLES